MAKSIIDIDVNSAQFQAFVALFEKYQKSVDSHSQKIKKLNDGWGAIGSGVKKVLSPVDHLTKSIEKVSKQFHNAETASQKIGVALKAADRTMTSVGKTTAKIAGSIASATLNLAKWAGFGLAGGLLGVGGGLFGIGALASSVSDTRRRAQGLGVSAGELKAAEVQFSRYTDVHSLLSNIAAAQTDVTKQWAFTGMNPNQSAAQLLPQILQKAANIYKAGPAATAQQRLEATGLTQLGISVEDARRYASLTKEEIANAEKKYRQDQAIFKLQDDVQRKWQDLDVKLAESGVKIKTVLIEGLTGLVKPIEALSDSFSGAVKAFLSSPKLKEWISGLGDKIQNFAESFDPEAFQKKVSDFLTATEDFAKKVGQMADAAWRVAMRLGLISPEPHPTLEAIEKGKVPVTEDILNDRLAYYKMHPHKATAEDEQFLAMTEKQYGLPGGMLSGIWKKESNRGDPNWMHSPAGAWGHMGMLPKTMEAFHVEDPFNLQQSATGTAVKLKGLLHYYKGDAEKALAAYNYGEGNLDKIIKQYSGDWKKHLPTETSNYIQKQSNNTPAPFNPAPMTLNILYNKDSGIDPSFNLLMAGGHYNSVVAQ